jgi:hypothetical protein
MLKNNITRFRCYSKFKYRKNVGYKRDIYSFRAMGETDYRSLRSDHKMKMSIEQKAAYKAYRAECRVSNVEPNRADFLAGDIPACVSYQLALQKPKALAATA